MRKSSSFNDLRATLPLFWGVLALLALVFPSFAVAFQQLGPADSQPVSLRIAPKKPNFVFILADDQDASSLGCYGNQVCRTPNLDALARRGMRFTQAYHMGAFVGAVCTPSRHMIMTGRTVWHVEGAPSRELVLHQIENFGITSASKEDYPNKNVPKNLADQSMPAVFNRAGYRTMRTCKKGNSFYAANKKFQIVHEAVRRQGNLEEGSAWHADRVIEFLDNRKTKGDTEPFLVYLGFSHPHDPRYANQDLLNKYGATNKFKLGSPANEKAPKLPINYLTSHPFHHGHPGLRDEVAVQGVMTNRDIATIRNEKGREYACIENMDQQIGRVLKRLEDLGELDNTYVIFTSDHGIAVGRHGLMGKQNLYEHSWRVPYLVAGPGISAGTAKGNIYLLDTLATLCELAGIEAPETNEGRSFVPILKGEQQTSRDVLYGVYSGGTKPGIRSVRKGDWKLIKYESLDGKVKETQLFNLAENPDELLQQHHVEEIIALTGNRPTQNQVDLAEDARYESNLTEMESVLLSEMKRLNDPYRFNENFRNPPAKPRKKRNRPKKPAANAKSFP